MKYLLTDASTSKGDVMLSKATGRFMLGEPLTPSTIPGSDISCYVSRVPV